MIKTFIVILNILVSISCASLKIEDDRAQYRDSRTLTKIQFDIRIPYLRYVSTPIDLDEQCRDQSWESVEASDPLWGFVVNALTIGIVDPTKVVTVCGEKLTETKPVQGGPAKHL